MPKAEVAILFDHLVGAKLEQPGDVQAERLGGLEVDGEVELGRLDDRQMVGFSPLRTRPT